MDVFKKFLLLSLFVLGTLGVTAQASETYPDWFFVGGNFGYTSVNPSSQIQESDKKGYQASLRILGSRYVSDWVFDMGLGWFYNKVSGDNQFVPGVAIREITRGGFVELCPRYRFNDSHWQLGPAAHALFGTNVSFDENPATDLERFALAAGVRGDYETGGEKSRWRFGAQFVTDLTISNRNVWWAVADIQFGIPIHAARAVEPEPTPVPTPTPIASSRPVAPKFAEVTPEKNIKIYLGEAVLRFKTAKSDLRPSSRDILSKVSGYLKKNDKAWGSMRIEGHADSRGKPDSNLRLSVRRAGSVKNALVKLGIPEKKLTTRGFGDTKPIDRGTDDEAYALNRRVELWLDGVSDPDSIARDLNQIQ